MKKKLKLCFYKDEGIKRLIRIMKTVVLFLLISTSGVLANYAQSTRLSINVKDASLRDVMLFIENQSEFYFLYKDEMLDVSKKVDINIKDGNIEDILEKILPRDKVKYEIRDRQILILGNNESTTVGAVLQQVKTISGRVHNNVGEPIPGVTVVVQGTTRGTITDTDGNYSLSNVSSDATLVFSFVGMKTQKIVVGNQSVINLVMTEDAIGIDEVVAIGYGTMKKSDLTGSVASVKSEDLETLKVTSPEQALSGRIAGVQITQVSSAPGGAVSIRIRGGNSVNGGNEPLYVIDGFPIGSSNFINPNDIESIEVLKDASATAIYGARGANGVILITTKKGSSGAASITFQSYYGVQTVKQLDLMNAEQFATFVNEYADQKGITPYFQNPSSLGEGTNWQDHIFRTAPVQNYQLGVSGGQGKTKYYVSGNYYRLDGVIERSNLERYSLRTNLETEVGNRIKIGTTFLGTRSINNRMRTDEGDGGASGAVRAALYFHPFLDVYHDDGTYTTSDEDITDFLGTAFSIDNPVAVINETTNQSTNIHILSNVYGELNLAKGLYLKVSLGADVNNGVSENYYTRNITLGRDVDGVASISANQNFNYLNENTLSYSTDIAGGHQVNVLVGYTRQKESGKSQSMSNSNFLDDILKTNGIESGTREGGPSIGAGEGEWQLESWLGRVNYKFQDKYLLTMSARADGSSRLGKNNRWGFFPSGALAWNVYKEDFMKNLDVVQNLKLRVSYGFTGNTNIGSYRSLSSLSSVYYSFNDTRVLGYFPGQLPNGGLRWESTAQFNAGVDVGFFNGRLTFTGDYYIKNTDDLLLNVTLPISSGYSSVLKNTGRVRNEGIELSVGATVLKSSLIWETNLNWSMNKNKLVDLGDSESFFVEHSIVDEGQPLGAFYGYKTDGIFKTQAEAEAYTAQSGAKAGDLKIVDVEPDGLIDSNDRTVVGSPHPDFIFGWNNTFRYKGFSLTAFISGVVGNRVYNRNEGRGALHATWTNHSLQRFEDRWTIEHTDASLPRAGYEIGSNDLYDLFLEDASFVRLKTLQLGYNIPLKNFWQIRNAFIYASGQNLFTITDYSGYNPEVNTYGQNNVAQGYDIGAYPMAKTYLLGIKVEF